MEAVSQGKLSSAFELEDLKDEDDLKMILDS